MNVSPCSLVHPRDDIVQTMDRIYRYRMTTTSGALADSGLSVKRFTLSMDELACQKPD